MDTNPQPQNVPAVVNDGFATSDPTDSPLRGVAIKFKDGSYFSYGDKIDVEGKSFAVIGKTAGWQKLERGCPPEYLIRQTGAPKPAKPFVDEKDWPAGFNNQPPSHPWKWAEYIYLLNTDTGEFSTFWSNTTGGIVAVHALDDQVKLMRTIRPNAMPVIALQSAEMPTQYGGTTPRPHFQLLGWKAHGSEQALLGAPEQNLIDVEEPSSEEVMDEKGWDAKGDPTPDLSAETPKKKARK